MTRADALSRVKTAPALDESKGGKGAAFDDDDPPDCSGWNGFTLLPPPGGISFEKESGCHS